MLSDRRKMEIHIRQYVSTANSKNLPDKERSDPLDIRLVNVDCLYTRPRVPSDRKWNIANGIFIKGSCSLPTVDIKQLWKPNEKDGLVPTKNGVNLNDERMGKFNKNLRMQ